MQQDSGYYVIRKQAVPEVLLKVVEAKIPTAYVHPTYGPITANRTNKPSFIEVEDGVTTYYFNFEYTVDAGSFGDAYDYFVVNP